MHLRILMTAGYGMVRGKYPLSAYKHVWIHKVCSCVKRLHSNELDILIQSGLMYVQIALIPIYVEIGIMHTVHYR